MTNSPSYYWLGGFIAPENEKAQRTYVARSIDDDLYSFLIENPEQRCICSIFAARQMGKSSLILNIKSKINNNNKRLAICTQVDFQSETAISSEAEIYKSIIVALCSTIKKTTDFDLENDAYAILANNTNDSPSTRFKNCLQFLIQKQTNKRLVIFFDEIEYLYERKLLDYLLITLKSIAQDVDKKNWNNIVFVLVGCINPNILVDSQNFSLNICKEFQIPNFAGQCKPLWGGLEQVTNNPDKLIKSILKWTGGKPFLTQYFCSLFERDGHLLQLNDDNITKNAEKFIQETAVKELITNDPNGNLHEIDKKLIYLEQDKNKINHFIEAVSDYKRIFRLSSYSNDLGNPIYYQHTYAHNQLLISGIAIAVGGVLAIACLAYKERFNLKWADQRLEYLNQKLEEIMSEKTERDYVLIIDRSPSMEELESDGRSRWETIQESTCFFIAKNMERNDSDGFVLYFFSDGFERFDEEITAGKVKKYFRDLGTGGMGTDLAKVIKHALDNYFERKNSGLIKKGGEVIIVVTDGEPNRKQPVIDEIVNATTKINDRSELGIGFIGIGNDPDAINFLKELDNELVGKYGAKCDICHYTDFHDVRGDFNKLVFDIFNK